MTKYRSQLLIILIFLGALGIRLWGIGWGLPNQYHAVSYHPDETVILLHSTTVINPDGLNVFAGQFLPHFYNYGSLQLVLIDLAAGIAAVYAPTDHTSSIGSTLATVYSTGRLLTCWMGAFTVAGVWALGRRVYGDAAGLIGALLLAIAPLHAQHSHFMTVDVPATMWVTFALLWSVRASTDEIPLRALIIGAMFAGFAAATKYNCALVLMPLLISGVIAKGDRMPASLATKAGRLFACILAMSVAYLIGCPGTILESREFIADFLFESHHVMSQQELWFQGTGNGWWYILSRNLDAGLSLPLLLAGIAGFGYAAYKRTVGDLLTLSFFVPYYVIVGAAVSRYARYEIPLLPILVLLAARIIVEAATSKNLTARAAAYVAGAVVIGSAAVSCALLLRPLSQPDPRDRADQWIISHSDMFVKIGVPTEPWFYTPPIDRFFPLPGYGQWETMPEGSHERQRLVFQRESPFDLPSLQSENPAIVVLSEYEYYDRLRLHNKNAEAYVAYVKAHYLPPIVFADTHPLGGLKTIGGLPCQDLPTDMLYTSPTILVYRRR